MHRLSISLLLVVVVAIFGLGVVLDALFDHYNTRANDPFTQVREFGQALASVLNNSESPDQILADWPKNNSFDIDFESKSDLPLPSTINETFESGAAVVLESDQGVSFYYYLHHHDKVLALQSKTVNESSEAELAWLFTGAFYTGTLVMVLLWLKPLLHRLHVLRNATRAFGTGQLERRVKTTGVTYISDIEKDFNRMADKIQQLIEDNKLLTSAVSHDLRTPLARLRFGVDTLAETSSAQAREHYINRINKDLSEMEALVNSLLRYARLDNVMAGAKKQPVPIRNLVDECISQYCDTSVSIVVDYPNVSSDEYLTVNGCIEHLATLINNLIQNAIRYASHQIVLGMTLSDANVILTICDDGPGIPSKSRELVMKPFERGTDCGRDGYGLGLAVAARIAKHHGGYIRIDDCERLGGALVSVCLERQLHQA